MGEESPRRPRAEVRPAGSWQEPEALGWIEVKVYELARGQTQIRVKWPEGARDDTPEGIARQNEFLTFVKAELDLIDPGPG